LLFQQFGTATFKRVNGEALAVCTSKTPTVIHTQVTFMQIQQLKVVDCVFFKPVTGGTGLSTNLSKLDNGTAFGYDQLLTFNGYINFHQSTTNLASLVAQGDIGQMS
jgi:hypothetical protein